MVGERFSTLSSRLHLHGVQRDDKLFWFFLVKNNFAGEICIDLDTDSMTLERQLVLDDCVRSRVNPWLCADAMKADYGPSELQIL